jgi:succinate-acetate transporter protein
MKKITMRCCENYGGFWWSETAIIKMPERKIKNEK